MMRRVGICHSRFWVSVFVVVVVSLPVLAGANATAVDRDAFPPTVIQRSPARGEELRVDDATELVFDRAMDRTTVEAAFAVHPTTSGTFDWPDDRTVRFHPTGEWARDEEYVIHLAQSARGLDGRELNGPLTFGFRTVGYLELAQVVPADGATAIEATSSIAVMFNRPVVPLTALSDPDETTPTHPLEFSPRIVGVGEWTNTSIYVFRPSEPLAGGTTYTATVAAGLSDVTGGVVREDVTWTFTTERPKVVWVSPGRDADLVPVDSEVRVTFNMPMDPTSVVSRFTLRTKGLLGELFARDVEGTVSTEGENLIFTPTDPLDFDREYTASVDAGITAHAGGLGTSAPHSWSFRTVPLPRILGTTPEDGESAAYSYTSFLIHFNAPIDPESVMDNLTIEPEPDPADLDGYFRHWDNTFVVRFGARPSQKYTFRIGPDIADPYGNTTKQRMTVRFQTTALPPSAWLHVPGQVGTYDANEPGRIFVAHRNTDTLRLTLTRLSVDEYLDALYDWYEFSPPSDAMVRSWSVSVSAPLNELGYTPVSLLPEERPLDPGVYLVELRADDVEWNRWQHRHILIASSLNLTLKTTDDQILAWATDLHSGEPVPGLILWARNADGEPLDVEVTDSYGLACFSTAAPHDWRGVTVIARSPFTLASSEWDDGISSWEFGFTGERPEDQRVYLDTDRPIYRPAQTVYFRGIVRSEDDVSYSLPQVQTVDVTVRDAAWDLVYDETVTLDPFGTFSGTLPLPAGAVLGTYWINVTADDRTASASFQVAAYRPPEFEVTVTPDRGEVASGEPVLASVNVSYFFGAPVAGVPVEWRVVSEAYQFVASQFRRYTFSDIDDPWVYAWWWLPPELSAPILEGSGQTDENGVLVLRLADDLAEFLSEDVSRPQPRRLTIEATVRGADGQTLSGRGRVIVHPANIYVGMASGRTLGRASEEMSIDVITVDWSGERVAGQTLTYTVFRREWVNSFAEDDTGGGQWTWTTNDVEIAKGSLTTDTHADGRLFFVPPEGGTYKIVAAGQDDAGRVTHTSLFVWVSGAETVSWRRANDDRITLISDKTSYSVGETAEILIPSPYPGEQWALITVERGGILSREVVRLPSNSSTYRLPITEDHIPNVYVSVVVVQGREAALRAAEGSRAAAGTKVGYAVLSVDPLPKTLRITIVPSAEQTQPGTQIDFDVSATDTDGNPVKAAFSFDLVDKAILTLSPRVPDAIVQAFYGHRGLGVRTASGLAISVNRLVLEQLEDVGLLDAEKYMADADAMNGATVLPAAREFAPEETAGAEQAGAGDQLPAGVELREDFLDTAYWDADVVTDENGQARLTIELPDNLTTWIARAVGVTRSTSVGEQTAELLVTKPLVVRPVTPRFFVVGDRVQLAASISNRTGEDRTVEVTIGHVGLSLGDPAVQTVHVSAGGEAKVTWWATVQDVPAVDLAFSAVSGDAADAARPRLATGPEGTLAVYRYTAPETVGTAGQLTDEGSRTEVIALPADFEAERTELNVRVDPSIAAAMLEGLAYLEHFEYECIEQVVSRFLPNALTYRALRLLDIEDEELKAKLDRLVAEGAEKLSLRQNTDGGWGWWEGDRSSTYLTAYAAFGLLRVQQAGFQVEDRVVERALDFLVDALVPVRDLTASWEANRQAWVLYVLALGQRADAVTEHSGHLFEQRQMLSHYAKAYLALALGETDAPRTRLDTLLSDLINGAILSATGAHWEEPHYDGWAMNTDTRSTAIILDALVQLDPSNALIPNAVRWLMIARQAGIWETTQENAWALIALTDWMVETGELSGTYDYWVDLNDESLLAGSVTTETVRQPAFAAVGGTDLVDERVHRLSFSRGPGDGRLYYTAHLSVWLPVEQIEPLDRGIVVSRQYAPAGCPLDRICEDVNGAAVGAEIQVRLTIIAPHDLYYVVVEDPIPSGCEAIDPTLATTSILGPEPALFREEEQAWPWFYGWWWRWYTRSEMRDEKTVLFADYLPAGTYTYRYSLRAVHAGEFRVLPTRAYEFYFPEVFGRSDGRVFTVLDEESLAGD